jgi:hypothetical protein
MVFSHNQTRLHITMCIFLNNCFFHAHNCTKIIIIIIVDNIKKPNTFFQVRMFGHRVSFRCLHKGLWPFTGGGMHKKGVGLPGDVWSIFFAQGSRLNVAPKLWDTPSIQTFQNENALGSLIVFRNIFSRVIILPLKVFQWKVKQ